ncbi:hypothetical protein J2744_001189 [Halorubrum trapanicum]|uniref:Uncharacterized protein n=1 Tax=Halorubrum trapanicum TaxID=29284 RepID=A0A8J7ULW7_9EURY|nr:hypothetical protein [Halorubrum trapanicum]MBP1901519.1 hypothetical protein [Halorubrum trapanicum]
MDPADLTAALSVALASIVLVVAAALIGLLDAVSPLFAALAVAVADRLAPLAAAIPDAGPSVESLLLVGLPSALALATAARGVANPTPADVALAAFAVPCLLVAAATVAVRWVGDPGVLLGGLVTFAAGAVLAVIVVVDAALTLGTTAPRAG